MMTGNCKTVSRYFTRASERSFGPRKLVLKEALKVRESEFGITYKCLQAKGDGVHQQRAVHSKRKQTRLVMTALMEEDGKQLEGR